LNLDYTHDLRSIFTAADEWVLQHNFNIPLSTRLHFPNTDSGAILDLGFGDVCI
jgi:hypothetical protein